MKLKKYISFLAVSLCLFALSAKVTAHYDLQATSFTNENLVKQRIGLPATAEYESVDAMKEKDLSFKQKLDNMRIFKNVDIVYSEIADQPDHYNVLFDIKSALTFVTVPYPKYDSNSGFSLKLRVLDTNFLGNLGNVDFTAEVVQETEGNDTNFLNFTNSSFDIYGSASVKVGNLSFSTSIDSDIYLENGSILKGNSSKVSDLDASFTVSGIKLGKLSMSNTIGAELDLLNIKDSDLSFKTSINGFKFGNVGMSLSALVRTTKVDLEGMEFGLSSGFSGMKLSDYPISFNPYFYAQVIDKEEKKVVPSRAGFSSGMSIGKHYFSTSFNNYWLGDTFDERDYDYPFWIFNASGSYNLAKWIKPSASVSAVKYTKSPWAKNYSFTDFLYSLTVSESLGFKFGSIPFTLGQSNTFYFGTETVSQNISFSTSYSKGAINYVKDDFRLGYKFSASLAGQYYFNTDWKETYVAYRLDRYYNDVRGHLEFTWFPLATQYFNPNFRVIATVCDKPLQRIYDYDDGTDGRGYGYGLFYGSETYLGDYLRGVRTLDKKALAVSDYQAAALVNVNLTVRSEDLGSAMRFYFNPFFDGAVLYDLENMKPKFFGGAGLELISVISAYPSYPIRASVGFDIENFAKKLQNTISQNGQTVDGSWFEIYIGLHHFY